MGKRYERGFCYITDLYNIKDKLQNSHNYNGYMLNRALRIFEYENLPETISQFNAERLLLINGACIGTEVEGKYYMLTGGFGGQPDAYYLPTQYTVANPALNLSETYTLGEDCILFKNDSCMLGVMPLFTRYSTLLAENDISLWLASVNARIQTLVIATDDSTKASAELMMKHLIDGDLGVFTDESLIEGLKTKPYSDGTSRQLTQLIELHQYLKAGWFNDIGLQANYNMKREAINSNESQLNNDALFPLIDDMELCRVEAWTAFNEKYGTDVKVRRRGVWKEELESLVAEEAPVTGVGADFEEASAVEEASDGEEEAASDGEEEAEQQSDEADTDNDSESEVIIRVEMESEKEVERSNAD